MAGKARRQRGNVVVMVAMATAEVAVAMAVGQGSPRRAGPQQWCRRGSRRWRTRTGDADLWITNVCTTVWTEAAYGEHMVRSDRAVAERRGSPILSHPRDWKTTARAKKIEESRLPQYKTTCRGQRRQRRGARGDPGVNEEK